MMKIKYLLFTLLGLLGIWCIVLVLSVTGIFSFKNYSLSNPQDTQSQTEDSHILTHNFDIELTQCLEKSKSTGERWDCYNLELPKFDDLLKDVYIFVEKDKSADFIKTVKQMEASFAKYRGDLCDSKYELVRGGTVRGQIYGDCYIQATKMQIEQLCNFGQTGQKCEDMI